MFSVYPMAMLDLKKFPMVNHSSTNSNHLMKKSPSKISPTWGGGGGGTHNPKKQPGNPCCVLRFFMLLYRPWQTSFSVMYVCILPFYNICLLTYFHIKISVYVDEAKNILHAFYKHISFFGSASLYLWFF